ncbi:MAG TPA: hypothetical protein VF292_03985 [Rhodanobacteraceae bacterium]
MSIIKSLSVETVSGALKPVKGSTDEISIGKGQKAKVVMQGYIGGPQEKGDDGKYRSTVYGRLPVSAAVAGTNGNQRYVLDIAGGLHGVLFKAKEKKNDKSPDYAGNIDFGDQIMPLFGRKVTTQNGSFISLSSMKLEAKKDSGHSARQPAPAQAPEDDFGDDVPF